MPIRLMENFRAVFYAPYYATHALGFYKREGVDVELLTSDAPGDAVPKLIDGSIDLTWGGPMRVMQAHDQDKHSPLVSFCEVVSHDPFFLIGTQERRTRSGSPISASKRFASVSEVPTPWMCLQQDLRDQGIDPGQASALLRSRDDAQLSCAASRRHRRDAGVRAVRLDGGAGQAPATFSMRRARGGRPPTRRSSPRATPARNTATSSPR